MWLAPLGFLVGAYGTLIGAGGGFVLMPVLLWLYPNDSPATLTSISLAVVFFNAASGSLAYFRMKRIDFRSGWMFAIATVPGSILGAYSTSHIPRVTFNLIFGVWMVGAAIFLLLRPNKVRDVKTNANYMHCRIVDAKGNEHCYSFNPVLGVGISFIVGFVSSLLGIGGGIIHVPVLVHLLNFPVHIATATSHFVLAIMAFTGTVTHIISGSFSHAVVRTLLLAAGVLPGAQVGARYSTRLNGEWIIRGLAIALLSVGVRILLMSR